MFNNILSYLKTCYCKRYSSVLNIFLENCILLKSFQGHSTCPASLASGRYALWEMECEIVSMFLFLIFSSCGGLTIELSWSSISCNSPISSSDTLIFCLN